MSKKRMSVANFNVVFPEERGGEEPLLKYFDSVIYPAFKSGLKRTSGDSKLLLMNVEVIDVSDGEYAIVGNLVNKTKLEVLSELDENGELIATDNIYPAAPFSTFVIYLRNHRMVFVQNQKGSPTLSTFRSTINYIIHTYINQINQGRKQNELEEYPIPIINVVGIPMRESIEETLKNVKKVQTLTLRFYPLNGDFDFSGMFTGMSTQLRQKVGSKRGEVILKSPTSVSGIAEVLEDAGGTVEPVFKVVYPNGSTGTISNDTVAERMEIEVEGNNIQEEIINIASKGKKMKAVALVSESNQKIYEFYKPKVIQFIKK